MSNTDDIKRRLANIQNHFNPAKSTYKVLDHVINADLNSFGMLMELSKIRGVYNYPEDIKKEYISIINDLKAIITEERRAEYKRRKEESTQDLRNLIARLEKRKDLQPNNLKSAVSVDNEPLKKEEVSPKPDVKEEQVKESIIDTIYKKDNNSVVSKKEDSVVTKNNDKTSFVNTILMICLFIVIVIIILILLFY